MNKHKCTRPAYIKHEFGVFNMNPGKQTLVRNIKKMMWDGESITTSFTPGSRGALWVLFLGSWKDSLRFQERSRSLECLEVTFGTIEVDEFDQREYMIQR